MAVFLRLVPPQLLIDIDYSPHSFFTYDPGEPEVKVDFTSAFL